jgi:hypothetical protein
MAVIECLPLHQLRFQINGVVLFQRTVVLLRFYVLSSLIVKVSHRGDHRRDVV